MGFGGLSQPGLTPAADGEETASVLSWHTHAQQVRAAGVSLWSLQLQIVMGFIRWDRLANRKLTLRTRRNDDGTVVGGVQRHPAANDNRR
jgi:hypothetical protein